jgi:hypothetical protein
VQSVRQSEDHLVLSELLRPLGYEQSDQFPHGRHKHQPQVDLQ